MTGTSQCGQKQTANKHEERRGKRPASLQQYYYRIYGLRIASQLELPELPAISPCENPDAQILTHDVAETLEGGEQKLNWLQVGDDGCQVNIESIARYRSEMGWRIVVDRRMIRRDHPPASAGDVRLFLLGTVLAALLHQRNWLPLHVSALATPAGVWAFTGHSGAGKSTLGSWLNRHQGWPMLTDDVAVIKPEEHKPYLHPGPPRVKLWRDALSALGIETEGLVRDLSRVDKFHLMVDEGFQHHPQPLRALVKLERAEEGEAAELIRIQGVEAFTIILASLYRPEMGEEFNSAQQLMRDAITLAGKIRIYRFRRPWSLDDMNDNLAPLLDEIQSLSVGSTEQDAR